MTVALKQKVELIRTAIMNKNYLLIDYISSRRKSNVKIAPSKVIFKSAGWYLFGKSAEHNEFRFYKITRMVKIEITNEQFIPESASVPTDWSDDFDSNNGESVTIAFDKSMEYQVIDIFGAGNYSTGIDDTIIVTFNCSNKDWLIHFVLGFGVNATIIEPAELRNDYLSYLKKVLEKNHC